MTNNDNADIGYEHGGCDGPLLVLLHGLGANAAVWDGLKPMVATRWPGRWIIPDLRGHGRSSHRGPYSIKAHAGDVARLCTGHDDVTLLGHSMGGLIALALASGHYGMRVRRAIAFSVKVDWTDEDHARSQALARTPAKLFDTRDEAIDRYLRVAGLKGLVDPQSAAAAAGIRAVDGKFRLAADPAVNDIGTVDFGLITAAVRCPVCLLCGDTDPIASPAGMQCLGFAVRTLAGLGHNPHVEDPQTLWAETERFIAGS